MGLIQQRKAIEHLPRGTGGINRGIEGVCGGHVQFPPLPVLLNIINPIAPCIPAAPGPSRKPLRCRSCIPSQPQAQFCHVPKQHVLTMHDVSNIWRVPLIMESQSAHHVICK